MHALIEPAAALRIGATVLLLGALFFAVPAIAADASGAGKDSSEQMHRAMIEDMNEMNAMQMSGDIDRDFAQMMRMHHQSGVAMAERELRSGKDPEMLKMARTMIRRTEKRDRRARPVVEGPRANKKIAARPAPLRRTRFAIAKRS